jgi:hypothetical protein
MPRPALKRRSATGGTGGPTRLSAFPRLDTLADLGFAILPDTPMVHTASGGLHLYFEPPASPEIRNTGGARGRGIGPGLDWRGEGGFVIVPSSGNGYCWDPQWNPETAALAPVPTALLPRKPERRSTARQSGR